MRISIRPKAKNTITFFQENALSILLIQQLQFPLLTTHIEMLLTGHSLALLVCSLTTAILTANAMTCNPGYFKRGDRCLLCKPGTYSTVENAKACTKCPSRQVTGFRATSASECKFCPKGTVYTEGTGPPECVKCPSNTFQDAENAKRCKPCPSGTISAIGNTRCITCQPGEFIKRSSGRPGKIRCKKCKSGRESLKINMEECTECAVGTFNQKGLKGPCRPCYVGRFANMTGTGLCKKCEPGFFQNKLGSTGCEKCPEGSTSEQESSFCTPTCDPTKPDCNVKACSPGFGLNKDTNECEECPPLTINPVLSTTPCFQCPPGPDVTTNAARTKCMCKDESLRLRRGGQCAARK